MKCQKERQRGLLIGAILLVAQTTTVQAAPEILSVSDTGAYTTLNSELTASWTVADPDNEILAYQYRITRQSPNGTVIKGWTSNGLATSVRVTGLTLASGGSYFFEVRGATGIGVFTASAWSDGIIADSTTPVIHAVVDDGTYTTNAAQLHARWFASDYGTGVAGYRYAIGTAPGAFDVKGWTDAGTATEVTATGLSLTTGTSFYLTVEAADHAGNTATRTSDGILVDNLPPTVTSVTDGGDFTSAQAAIAATWSASDAHTGVVAYWVAVGTAPGSTDVKPWTAMGGRTSATIGNLPLAEGVAYYVSVRASDLAGNFGTASADGITTDWSAPAVTVTDEGVYTVSGDSLSASWSGVDSVSPITEYLYSVGTAGALESLVPWTSAGTATGVALTGLALADNTTYFVRVQAVDSVGNVGVAMNDGIAADLLAPPVSAVGDEGHYKATTDALSASWIVGYAGAVPLADTRVAVGTSPGAADTVAWTSVGLATSTDFAGLALSSGTTYYVSVELIDAEGRTATGASDGILIDTLPPTLGPIVGPGPYTNAGDSLSFSWSGADADAGVREYYYAVGTVGNASSVVPWTSAGLDTQVALTGLAFAEGGTYLISVSVHDRAGNVTQQTTTGTTVDLTAPEILYADDGDLSAGSNIPLEWYATDALSGLAGYRYAVGTTPGGVELVPWTDAGTTNATTLTGLSLPPGTTAWLTVEAADLAGNTATLTADGILIDPAAPVVTGLIVSAVDEDGATISFQTDKPASTELEYGLSPAYGSALSQSVPRTSHKYRLSGLTSQTQHHFRILATSKALVGGSTPDQTFTTTDEPVRNQRLGDAGESYIDPEILQGEAKMTYRMPDGSIWVADIDPQTGTFLNGGNDYLMDVGGQTGPTVNGPEFGVDADGWAVFYPKPVDGTAQIWRSTWDPVGQFALAEPLTSGGWHETSLATQDPGLLSTRILTLLGTWETGGDLASFDDADPSVETVVTESRHDVTNRQQAKWAGFDGQLLVIDPDTGQIYAYDPGTGTVDYLTDDDGFKTAPLGWYAPELGGDRALAAVIDDSVIGVWRDTGGEYWERVSTLPIPAASDQTTIASPEVVTTADKSYIVLLIKDRPTRFGQHTDGEVWVFDISGDADTRTAVRCDGGEPAVARTDPEIFVGSEEIMVYYNIQTTDTMELWTCRTGIPVQSEPGPVLATGLGTLEGVYKDGADVFKGIPYAQAPVDDLRWRAPVPYGPWQDTLDASRFAPMCPQRDPDRGDRTVGSEDCLFLNVWTPTHRGPDPLPVIAFVHGGGNATGAGNQSMKIVLDLPDDYPFYDAARLAARGDVVVVTMNYRLAALGYLAHPSLDEDSPSGTSGNYGILDIIAALQWVQDNIADFGGDPGRVTIVGESGGAQNVGVLVATPLSAGLFSRAVMESGAMRVDSPQEALFDAELFIEDMGLTGSSTLANDLRALPYRDIARSPVAASRGIGSFAFEPHVDGWVLADQPLTLVAQGLHNPVPFVIGTNADEYAHQFSDLTDQDFYDNAATLVLPEQLDHLLDLYPLTAFDSPSDAWATMLADHNLTCVSRSIAARMADNQYAPVWRYLVTQVPSTPLRKADGAYHASELLYLFQHMDGDLFEADESDAAFQAVMLDYWTRFAETGVPGGVEGAWWPEYVTGADPYLELDDSPQADSALIDAKCDFFEQHAIGGYQR